MKPLWLFDNTSIGETGDDLSYWLHSATLAFDYDIDYKSDHPYETGTFNSITKAPSHPPGAGYISSPFVLLFNLIDHLLGNDVDRLNPIGSFAYLGFFFSTQFFTISGFYFLNKLFISRGSTKYKLNVLMLCFLSTLVHYSSTRFLMAHAIEFYLMSHLIYLYEKSEKFKEIDFRKSLIIYFLLAITRPSTFIIGLCILLMHYKKIKKFLFLFKNQVLIGTLVSGYVAISIKLYNSYTILLNLSNNKTTESFSKEIKLSTLLDSVVKIPNLFFSTSGGLLWFSPIIFLGVFVYFFNTFKNEEVDIPYKFFSLVFIIGFFIVAMVWQGREVAYGQRLFIGLSPYLSFQTFLYIKSKRENQLVFFMCVVAYFHYLFFYSSELLTLREGVSLWGSYIEFSAAEYTNNLMKEVLNFSNYITIFAKTIYTVNLLSLIDFQYIFNYLPQSIQTMNNVDIMQIKSQRYIFLNYSYVLFASSIHLLFSYLFVKLIKS